MANVHKASRIPEQKKETVSKIADLIKKYPIIGALNMENLPAAQLQRMKANLREKVIMLMAKRRLIKLAIEQAKKGKKGIERIEAHLKGMPALLFTNENPFTLFKIIKKSKSKAPAKAGQTAPADIVVKAGPTPFAPGPVISELSQLGIKTKVEAGKIAILADTVVCKEGATINDKLAGMLIRLGIEPMQIGLDLVAVYEKGDIFTKSVLDIDEEKFMADLSKAASWAFNLSVEAAFATAANREMLIQKAFRESKALAVSQGILADAAVADILAKAEREMLSLKSSMPELPAAADAQKAEEKPAEKLKAEEKKEEPKKEEKPKKEAKPEPKKEEPKPEEKPKEIPEKLESEIPNSRNEVLRKVEEPKQEIAKPAEKAPDVDKKVKNLVEQAKMRAGGRKTAETLVNDAEKEADEKRKKDLEEVEKVEQLAKTLVKKGDLHNIPENPAIKKEKPKKDEKKDGKKSEVEEVEELTKQLLKKGTLRK